MKFQHIITMLLLLLLLAAPAAAQDYGQDTPYDYTKMAPFSPAELSRFLNDWPAFTRWAESRGEELDQSGNEAAWTGEAAKTVSALGWEPERFFYVAHQCALGISGLAMDAQGPAMMAELTETRSQIMEDQTMTPEQKQMMLQMLEQSQGGIVEMQEMQQNIPAQEMAMIKAKESEIRRVMQVEE